MKTTLQYLAILACLLAIGAFVPGCAGCPTCHGAEWRAVASPQADDAAPPPPAPPKPTPHARPLVPDDDFATPPTDGPDPAVVDPPTPPAPTKPTVKTRLVKETEGAGIVIESSGSGSIVVNSPGTAPAPSVPPSPPAAPQLAAYPLIPGPLTDAQYVGLAKRLGGGLYYAVTGKCPTSKAATMQVPVATSYVQQVHYATVPVQTVPVQAAPQYVAVAAAPMPAPTPALYALPPVQAFPQTYATPQFATPPTAPRKGLFKCFQK